jgi:hypothetical protein
MDDLGGHHFSYFPAFLKIISAIKKRVVETYSPHCQLQSVIEKLPSQIFLS